MAYQLKDYPDLFTKQAIARQIFPHLPCHYGWKKIRMAVGDDPCCAQHSLSAAGICIYLNINIL